MKRNRLFNFAFAILMVMTLVCLYELIVTDKSLGRGISPAELNDLPPVLKGESES